MPSSQQFAVNDAHYQQKYQPCTHQHRQSQSRSEDPVKWICIVEYINFDMVLNTLTHVMPQPEYTCLISATLISEPYVLGYLKPCQDMSILSVVVVTSLCGNINGF